VSQKYRDQETRIVDPACAMLQPLAASAARNQGKLK